MTFPKFIILVLLSFVFSNTYSQDDEQLRLIFAGDIMCHQTQLVSAYDSVKGVYSFDSYFQQITPLISSADLAIANLETTFSGNNYSGYPEFSSPDDLAYAILNAGFNCLVTANNHSLDKGIFGLERSISLLNQLNIFHTGTFSSQEEKDLLDPLIIDIKGHRLAILNYSYGINSPQKIDDYLINTLDTMAMSRSIKKAKSLESELLICFLHWGVEYKTKENQEQETLSEWLYEQGVKLVIGSHPHVVQAVTTFSKDDQIKALTAFSLGNLISNQRSENRKNGLILEVILEKRNGHLEIIRFHKHPTQVIRLPLEEKDKYLFEIILPALPSPTSQTADL